MKKIFVVTLGIILLISVNVFSQNLKDLKKAITQKANTSKLSEEEIASGLKEALTKGTEKGVSKLSKKDGFFKDPKVKIPLPEEAKPVESKMRKMGQGKIVDDAIESVNRAAEDAVIGAKDIFVDAIKNMTITDAINILNGDNDAATRYLEKSTRTTLVEKFKPVVKKSLDKVGATKYWNTLFSTYNKIPLVQDVNPDLDDYVTNKTIDGLFYQIAKEELAIRKNPAARTSDLLKKVFQ